MGTLLFCLFRIRDWIANTTYQFIVMVALIIIVPLAFYLIDILRGRPKIKLILHREPKPRIHVKWQKGGSVTPETLWLALGKTFEPLDLLSDDVTVGPVKGSHTYRLDEYPSPLVGALIVDANGQRHPSEDFPLKEWKRKTKKGKVTSPNVDREYPQEPPHSQPAETVSSTVEQQHATRASLAVEIGTYRATDEFTLAFNRNFERFGIKLQNGPFEHVVVDYWIEDDAGSRVRDFPRNPRVLPKKLSPNERYVFQYTVTMTHEDYPRPEYGYGCVQIDGSEGQIIKSERTKLPSLRP